MSEAELVKGCCKGDNQARRQLYELYAGQLMAVCVRYVGEREVARDVLHDAFLKIFRSFHQFEVQGEGSLKAWMIRIVVNEAIGYLRNRSLFVDKGMDELAEVEEDVEDDVGNIPRGVLMKFIQELPDGYRTVFNLYAIEGRGHKEIARLLGISEHTSSSQLARARAVLVKRINNYRKRMQDEGRR